MGREQGHRVPWPCSEIPMSGWEQPLGWLEMPAGQSPTWSLAVPTAPASQRGGESPPCLEQPPISELSALPWPVGAAAPASCSRNGEGEGIGTMLGHPRGHHGTPGAALL